MRSSHQRKRLVVFLKSPKEGRVKTRLAMSVGQACATHLYRQMIHCAFYSTKQTGAAVCGYVSGNGLDTSGTTLPFASFRKQVGGDLGERMTRAFEHEFSRGFKRVVIIGTDCPGVSKQHIQKTYKLLKNHACVLGPAKDGGYYLIGLNHHAFGNTSAWKSLFTRMQWSRKDVLKRTLAKLKKMRVKVGILSPLSDLDTIHDFTPAMLDRLYSTE